MRYMEATVQLLRFSTNSRISIKFLVPEDITTDEWHELEQVELEGLPGFQVFATQFS